MNAVANRLAGLTNPTLAWFATYVQNVENSRFFYAANTISISLIFMNSAWKKPLTTITGTVLGSALSGINLFILKGENIAKTQEIINAIFKSQNFTFTFYVVNSAILFGCVEWVPPIAHLGIGLAAGACVPPFLNAATSTILSFWNPKASA